MHFNFKSRKMILDRPGTIEDYISINNRDKFIEYLWRGSKNTGKGGNAFLFKIVDCNDDEDDQVIKICRQYGPTQHRHYSKRINRFEREIAALKRAQGSKKNDLIIKIICDGVWKEEKKVFRYYVMEMADYDLSDYLSENVLSIQSKVHLCYQLVEAIGALHEIGIYHRDIKPANILFVNDRWKIGDLGLVKFRDEDVDVDDLDEKIGPYGFLSPEAVNKALGNKGMDGFKFDCEVDGKSDVFQIGKVMWYILQGEVPTGQLLSQDFNDTKYVTIYNNVIIPSLQFSKKRRPDIHSLTKSIYPICKELAIF